jgi:hypothetical protein
MSLVLNLKMMVSFDLDLRKVTFHIFNISKDVSLGIIRNIERMLNINSLLLDRFRLDGVINNVFNPLGVLSLVESRLLRCELSKAINLVLINFVKFLQGCFI